MNGRRQKILYAVALSGIGALVAIWWSSRTETEALRVCDRFVMQMTHGRCREAFKLSLDSTYSWSSPQGFCARDPEIAPARVVSRSGEWRGEEYVVNGILARNAGYELRFGMVMRQIAGQWYVVRWSFDD